MIPTLAKCLSVPLHIFSNNFVSKDGESLSYGSLRNNKTLDLPPLFMKSLEEAGLVNFPSNKSDSESSFEKKIKKWNLEKDNNSI